MLQLPSVSFDSVPRDLLPPELVIASLPRPQKRLIQLLAKGSSTHPDEATKSWSLDFLLSPHSLHWSSQFPYHLSHVQFTRNELDPSDPFSPSAKTTPLASSSGRPARVNIPANIFFRSIGYKASPLPGFEDLGIRFTDHRGTIPNDGFGRVTSSIKESSTPDGSFGSPLPGLYCAGWVKRGPTGVIASTMTDAFATADTIAADWKARSTVGGSRISFLNSSTGGSTGLGWEGVRPEAENRGLSPTSWRDWELIDAAERERGKQKGKPRDKFSRIEEMLQIVK